MQILYHIATEAQADRIDASGFFDEAGTYKATGIPLEGVFFSSGMLDSNEDVVGSVAYSIDVPEGAPLEEYEIIESVSDHRKFCIPATVANGFARRRVDGGEARALPVADRANDPAFIDPAR